MKTELLSTKELKDLELVKQHQALLESFMKNELAWKLKRRRKIQEIYKQKIKENNIRFFFNRPLELFLKALITNKLDIIADYFPKGYNFKLETTDAQ